MTHDVVSAELDWLVVPACVTKLAALPWNWDPVLLSAGLVQ